MNQVYYIVSTSRLKTLPGNVWTPVNEEKLKHAAMSKYVTETLYSQDTRFSEHIMYIFL